MINYLFGEVIDKDIDEITIDVSGVGYAIKVSVSEYEKIVQGDKVKIFIHENIKEDTYDLYGFLEKKTIELFRQLLSVKNVGPKVALAIFAIGSENMVRQAIAGGDVKKLQSAKGVGKRAAEQIVVELRDKVGLVSTEDAEGVVSRGAVNENDEAIQALIALGYNDFDAQKALSKTDKDLPTEERIKQALKGKF